MTTSLPSPDISLSDTASQPDDQPISVPKTSAATQSSHDLGASGPGSSHQMANSERLAAEKMGRTGLDAKTKMSNLLKDKEQEWTAVLEKKGPLQLLDLPMDVLKDIVKEVTHTNDLTALALAHSALHNLAIPHIYSRFDIVWPDAHATTDPRTGVDALTYGLATLCMGEVYTDCTQLRSFTCSKCGTPNTAQCNHTPRFESSSGRRRLGNQYPQFTRKFSLGNGPADWVQEYLITKESGKMLGTLVALAVARMINLETFVWDMPTGVLRDVWLALSSLQYRNSSLDCRLERVWVRWHDNSDTPHLPPPIQSSTMVPVSLPVGSTLTSIGWTIPSGSTSTAQTQPQPSSYSQSRVEYPTLSVLPPLRSLSVLDIDELDYLDEMSILIANSKDRLRELRVGISAKAGSRDFAIAWDGPGLYQVDHNASWPGASTIEGRRLGGVLGVLLGRVFEIRKKQKAKTKKIDTQDTGTMVTTPSSPQLAAPQLNSHIITPMDIQSGSLPPEYTPETAEIPPIEGGLTSKQGSMIIGEDSQTSDSQTHLQLAGVETELSGSNVVAALASASTTGEQSHSSVPSGPSAGPLLRHTQARSQKQNLAPESPSSLGERLEGKLRLQTLELERVSLSVAVLQKGFDWSVLSNLTILDCAQHDRLWVMLRRHFLPTPLGAGHSSGKHGDGTSLQYHLNLKKIHTDAASPALISFLKETLAPNTLETLFLQDRRRSATSSVTIDAIYRGPLKRHRGSLRKLLLDSSDRIPRGPTNSSDNTRWRAWMPNRDVLNFMTSGRMSSLRELSIAVDYKDWHHFLQRLPQIPHLRSLNIPFIADHVTPAFDPRELALQVVDVIVLRPEVELCYMGISHKCFEILENRPHDEVHGLADAHSSSANGGPGSAATDEEEEEEASDEDGSDDDDEQEDEDNGTAIVAQIDPDETESELSDQADSDSDSYDSCDDSRSKIRLRLREILFYDDKVAIFKARHGRL